MHAANCSAPARLGWSMLDAEQQLHGLQCFAWHNKPPCRTGVAEHVIMQQNRHSLYKQHTDCQLALPCKRMHKINKWQCTKNNMTSTQ